MIRRHDDDDLQAGCCIIGIKRRGKQHMTNSGNHPKYVSDINNEAHNV